MVAKKTKMPILSTTGLSFCWPLAALFCSSASMGTTGSLGVNLGPMKTAHSGTMMRTGHVPMVKSMARMDMPVKP